MSNIAATHCKKPRVLSNVTKSLCTICYLIPSFKALPGLKAGTLLAGISISSPVCGIASFTSRTFANFKVTKANQAVPYHRFAALRRSHQKQHPPAFVASFLDNSVVSATFAIKSVLFIPFTSPQGRIFVVTHCLYVLLARIYLYSQKISLYNFY